MLRVVIIEGSIGAKPMHGTARRAMPEDLVSGLAHHRTAGVIEMEELKGAEHVPHNDSEKIESVLNCRMLESM